MKDFSEKAKFFILSTIILGTFLGIFNLIHIDQLSFGLFILAILASVAQVLKVEGSTNRSNYNLSWLVYGFTLVLIGVPETFLVILVAHLIEWAWHKYPWYIQLFNIASFAIGLTIAGYIKDLIDPWLSISILSTALSTFLALVAFTLINHGLVGLAIWAARGQTISQSGVLGFLTLMIDFTLIGLGAVTALVWETNPFMIIFALIPIYLIYSTLQVPALQRQTQIDPKTKLFNARYFADVLKKELNRASRYDRPLTLVMGDLDLLRNINNTYGHLAGDVVLIGVADLLRDKFRGYDIVARFGGEEFAILMPETNPEEVFHRIEDVRRSIEAAEFEVSTSVSPIKATISFGVAERDGHISAPEELVHNADISLYMAKLNGRNTTYIFSGERIEGLNHPGKQDLSPQDENPSQSRLDSSVIPFQPNPLRKQKFKKSTKPAKIEVADDRPLPDKPHPLWRVNLYVGIVTLVAILIASLSFVLLPPPDMVGVFLLSLIILLTEGLSIDIYAKETSVSTASAPLIAGALLYGPLGVLILSLVLAGTSMVKNHSKFRSFLFNFSNHFISGSLCAFVVLLAGAPFTTYPVYIQIVLALFSGMTVFICSTLLISGVISLSMGQSFKPLWKQRYRWLWVHYMAFGVLGYVIILGYTSAGIICLVAVLVPLLALRISQIQYIKNTKANVTQLRSKNTELEKISQQVENLNEDLLLSFANIIDLRDTYTMGHSSRVADYAVLLAKEMGLGESQVDLIRKSSLLHDIGKIGIPDSILFKSSDLTSQEREIMMEHPTRGANIVALNRSLRDLAPTIQHHHEWYDGRGYPDGLKGDKIPLEARILCLADAVQAMASNRPYRKRLSLEEIKAEVSQHADTQFDPEIACIFLEMLENGKVILDIPILRESELNAPMINADIYLN